MIEHSSSIPERLLTYDEAGELLGVTGRTIFNLVERGELLPVRFGRCVRIDPTDLRAFIERSKPRRPCRLEQEGHSNDVE